MNAAAVRLALWITLGVAAVGSLGLYGREQRARGRAEAQLAQLRTENAALARVQARVDTVYRIQRDTFVVRRERLDTLTVTVDRWKRDTIAVVQYVERADSTVRACSALLLTCAQRDSLWRVRYANLERQVAAQPRPPPAWRVWGERIVIAWASYELGRSR